MDDDRPLPLPPSPQRLLVSAISGESASARQSLIQTVLAQAPNEGWKVALMTSDELHGKTFDDANKAGRCICCESRDQFISKVTDVANSGNFNSLLIDLPNCIGPQRVAEIFQSAFCELAVFREGPSARRVRRRIAEIHLDTMVSVVSMESVLGMCAYARDERPNRRRNNSCSEIHKLAFLLEFADIIVLEHSERLSTEDVDKVKKLLGLLNAEAGLLCTMGSEVASYEVLGRGDYMWQTLQVRQPTRKWMHNLGADHSGVSLIALSLDCNAACCALPPPSQQSTKEKLQAMSVQLRVFRPFCPRRLREFLEGSVEAPGQVVRITGTFWLASQPSFCSIWSTFGASTEFRQGRKWRSTENPQSLLVVIGYVLSHGELERFLQSLCISDEDFAKGAESWKFCEDCLILEPHVS